MSDADADAELEALLGSLVNSAIPYPQGTRDLAEAAWSARDLDAELATLSFDSLLETATTARGPGGTRHLTFETSTMSVELEVGPGTGDLLRLEGLLHPAGPGAVTVEGDHRSVTARAGADELGRFAAATSGGLRRLRIEREGTTFVTDWFHM